MPLLDQLNGGLGCEQPRIVMNTCSDLCMAKKFLCDMLSGATMKNSETTVPHVRRASMPQSISSPCDAGKRCVCTSRTCE